MLYFPQIWRHCQKTFKTENMKTSKTKISLLAYLATVVALIIGIGFLCYDKKISTNTEDLIWFVIQMIVMIMAISLTIQYAVSNYFSADGDYDSDEVATTGIISGIGTLGGTLLLLYGAYDNQWPLALVLFIIFEVAVFVGLLLFWSNPSVSKSGHARMYDYADDITTTPTVAARTSTGEPMSVGMIIGIVVILIIVSRLAMCSSIHTAQATGSQVNNKTADTKTSNQTDQGSTKKTPAVEESKPVRPEYWGDPRYNAMSGSNSNSGTSDQSAATGTESGQMK